MFEVYVFFAANPDLELVLSTLVEGAVESCDATAQKICFFVLGRLVQDWGELSFECGKLPFCRHIALQPAFRLK